MNYLKQGFNNMWDFDGRATRSEFWYFSLFLTTITVIIGYILQELFGKDAPILMIFSLVFYFPVSIRRMHDIGKSGEWLAVGLIPLIGAWWLLILFIMDSQQQENEYGLNPKFIDNQND